jgi:hypothetical protein
MNDQLRRQVIEYFEDEVGQPPRGVRERTIGELVRRPRQPRTLGWLAVLAALMLAAATVGVLSLSRLAARTTTSPAGQSSAAPSATAPGPSPGSGVAPSSRYGVGVAYDEARGELVVFGGVPDAGAGPPGPAMAETWTWAAGRWTLRHPTVAPSPRRDSLMTYDGARGVVVLFGGRRQTGAGPEQAGLTDTWTWDGRQWMAHPVASAPPFNAGKAMTMAYDLASRSVVLYEPVPFSARTRPSTWSWDGQRWTPLAVPVEPAMLSPAMVWDGTRMLLFGRAAIDGGTEAGGSEVMETWAWQGGGWVKLSPAAQPPLSLMPAAIDQERHQLVALVQPVVGEQTETWVWDGATWSKRNSAEHPPDLTYSGSMVYDTRSKQVLAYGRLVRQPVCQLWTWDGKGWSRLASWS